MTLHKFDDSFFELCIRSRYDPDDYSNYEAPGAKKEITPLPRIDHSKQDYDEIEKCFYEEHEDIAKLTEEQVRQIRQDLGQFNAFVFYFLLPGWPR